jgi:hypothetical protein
MDDFTHTKDYRIKLCLEAVQDVKAELNEAIISGESMSTQLEIMQRLEVLRMCLEMEMDTRRAS